MPDGGINFTHYPDSNRVPGVFVEMDASGANTATVLQRTLLKWLALDVPLTWAKGFRTRPEVEQGNGGSPPIEFRQDLDSLLSTYGRFCDALPTPHLPHPIFGPMTTKNWMRWGYLHADHHLRQFGR